MNNTITNNNKKIWMEHIFPSISDFTSGLKYEDLLLMPKFLHLCQMRSDKNYSVWLPNYWWWPKYASDSSCFTSGQFWILSLALISSEIIEYWKYVHYWGGVKAWPCLMQEKISNKKKGHKDELPMCPSVLMYLKLHLCFLRSKVSHVYFRLLSFQSFPAAASLSLVSLFCEWSKENIVWYKSDSCNISCGD